MHFVTIGEVGDQIQTDNGFRQSEIVYTQKWGAQEVVPSFHWQNNELNIDSGNTYLLSGDMLLKTNPSCQLIPQSAVLIQGLAASVQTGLQMSGCVRMLCPAVPRDDRTSVFAGQWEAYDPARDGQGNKGVTQQTLSFMYYHSSKEYANKNAYLDGSRNSPVGKILDITATYIVQPGGDAFGEITSLNFTNLSARSLTTTSNGSLIGVGGTVSTSGRPVFPGLAPTQASSFGVPPRTPSTPGSSIGSAAVRAQHSSPIPHMSQAQTGDGDGSETLTSSDDHPAFVEMDTEDAAAEASDDEMEIEAPTKKRTRRGKKAT